MEKNINVNDEEIFALVNGRFSVFKKLEAWIYEHYGIVGSYNSAGKRWNYEYKYVYKSKNFCYFYFKENVLGFMLIFGKVERSIVESTTTLSKAFMKAYNEATTYHDGKWVMLILDDMSFFADITQLLAIKHKPIK